MRGIRYTAAGAALAALAAIAACGGPPRPLERLYSGLSAPLPRIDPQVLAGRRIVIDPGHGGFFRGTVGRDSLEESNVNLGVALYLWGLLREAGADAVLTRSADRDFLATPDSSVAADLAERVALVDSLEPDVFLSVHHNAQPRRDPSKNSVETYYRPGDPASFDLATAIHRHLMRNLGIERGEVRQGNYFVLRETGVPAALGESSYLTNPRVEEKLKLSSAQRLEAEAYFLGLLEFFSKGIPRIEPIQSVSSTSARPVPLAFSLVDDGDVGIDPQSIDAQLDGHPAVSWFDPDHGRLIVRPPGDLANGPHHLGITARNVRGNAAPVFETSFRVDGAPASASVEIEPPNPSRSGGWVRVMARVLDARGLPVADGTPVEFGTVGAGPFVTRVAGGSVDGVWWLPPGENDLTIVVVCRGHRFERNVPRAAGEPRRALTVVDAISGRPIADAVVTVGDSVMRATTRSGRYTIGATDAGNVLVTARGFRPTFVSGGIDTVSLEPWFEGALHGRRFVIDPLGDAAANDNRGPLGLSGAVANLRVARYLGAFLRAAGARADLTRHDESPMAPEVVARFTNRLRADRYIAIRHDSRAGESGSPSVHVFHFPGSRGGRRLADDLGRALADRISARAVPASETVTYTLQQTACPAVIVSAPGIDRLEEELRLSESRYLREQAYGVFAGILRHFGVVDSGSVTVIMMSRTGGSTRDAAGDAGAVDRDRVDWRVTLDGTWTLVTGPTGHARFEAVRPGLHTLVARKGKQKLAARVEVGGKDQSPDSATRVVRLQVAPDPR